ncbi:MAG: ATP-binding cassette domain-containing protein [Clostridiales bacterium]|nr:ATP-binding cassette domain-containing protein [Clostridiales bacterium]
MIDLSHVSKTFEGASKVHAVNDVSLHINKGEIYGIVGFSGAGKSTLVRCMNLLEKPTGGKVTVDGQELTRLKGRRLNQERKKIGMIFQQFNLFATRTVLDNVAFPLRYSGMSRKAILEKARGLLKFVELEDKADTYPSQLSGGQKQRVAIARALASDPKVLLCDEATSALDPQTTTSILKLLKKLNAETGITIVVITHQMQVVKELCQRVAVMEAGRVVEEGEVYSVFANPQKPITQSFINTASNLSRVQEFLAENDSFNKLNPGEQIIRLKYLDTSAAEALVSTVSREYGVDMNIIFGNIEWIGNHLLGELIVIATGQTEKIPDAIEYLKNRNVDVEVLSHGNS